MTEHKDIQSTCIEKELLAIAETLEERIVENDDEWEDVMYVGLDDGQGSLLEAVGEDFRFESLYDHGSDGQLYNLENADKGVLVATSNSDLEGGICVSIPLSKWICVLLGIKVCEDAPDQYSDDPLPDIGIDKPLTPELSKEARAVEVYDNEFCHPMQRVRDEQFDTDRAAYIRIQLAQSNKKTPKLIYGVFGHEGDDTNW